VDQTLYEDFEKTARDRITRRDPDDWPVVAVAMLLDLPIWTEDQDFFGTGMPRGPQIESSCTFEENSFAFLAGQLSFILRQANLQYQRNDGP
jgi:predicted nucleic acid-binding protein